MRDLPKYVKLGNSVMRLRGNKYWCDSGDWGVSYAEADIITYEPINFSAIHFKSVSPTKSVDNQALVPISENEWKEKTGYYIPEGYVLQDGSVYSEEEEIVTDGWGDEDEYPSYETDIKATNYSYLLINN